MFICDLCKKSSNRNEKLTLVTTKVRRVSFFKRHPVTREVLATYEGLQIVKQEKRCPRCLKAETVAGIKQRFRTPLRCS